MSTESPNAPGFDVKPDGTQDAPVPAAADAPAARASAFPWLPIPFFAICIGALWAADLEGSWGSPFLLAALNFVFSTLGSLFVAFLVGRSFLMRPRPALLLVGCGVLIWGTVNVVSVAVGRSDVNANVTIYNMAAWVASACHLAGAILPLRLPSTLRGASVWLAAAYTAALGAVAVVSSLAYSDWMPPFFIQGQGGTMVRQVVLGSAIVMFVMAALLLRRLNRRSLSSFLNWYSLALLLVALGLFGVLVQASFGGVLNWTSRAAQYLGGVYMLVAAVASVRDSREWGITLEAALTEAHQQYRDLFELAGDGIAVHDLDAGAGGRFVRVNRALCGLLGYSPQEMRALSPADIVAEEERDALAREAGVIAGDGVSRYERTLVAKDGRRIAAEISSRAYRQQGRRMVVSVIRDITERRLAERQVRELSRRLTYHVENTPLAVIEFGPDMRLTRWSGDAQRLFGWRADEVLGKAPGEFRWVHEGDAPALAQIAGQIRTGALLRCFMVNRNYRKDGSVVHCEWYNSTLLDESGRMESVLSLVLDVTARKQAEAKLERAKQLLDALMEHVPEGITIAGADLRIRAVSRCGREMLGGELEGLAVDEVTARWKVYEPDGVTPMPEPDLPLVRAIRNGEVVRDRQIVQVNEAGRQLPLSCNAAPIREGNGSIVGGVVAWRDLTDHKRAEERLRQAQKLESVGLLAGGVAHDFNNILVGVIGNASLAQDLLPPGHPAVELLENVVKSGEHAAHLTRQMLAYAGKGRFVLGPVDVSAVAAEIADLVRPSIPGRIALHLDLEPRLPPVRGDGSQIQQVAMNLLLNGSEAIGGNAGIISLKTGVREIGPASQCDLPADNLRPGKYVFLEVRDTGCGMDEATRARIFDPFFTTKFTGRGLGLAAVAGIVRGHEGAIEVLTEPGKGSRFVALFPAAEGEAAAQAAGAAGAGELPNGSGTVLVVDDEEIVREMARRALERHGFNVLTADGGPSAIEVLKNGRTRIALAILDLSMPGMSGEEALRELRKVRPGIKVLASSGYSEEETLRLFDGQHLSGFIQKPYTAGRLAEAVKNALR